MDAGELLALGLGVTQPWRLVSQHLEIEKSPHELHLALEADRGSMFACPECGRSCKAHDFAEFRWRHLNFFQHHCYITARVPRTDCPEHGVKPDLDTDIYKNTFTAFLHNYEAYPDARK